MSKVNPSWSRWGRPLLVALVAAGITWVAFGMDREVPLLDQFDLAVHETGHLLAAFMPRLVMFIAGSAAQVAFPLAMAGYFWVRRRDAAAAGFCLAWAGTSARDVSVYAGDAVRQALPLVGGGEHDWANILGPRGFDALGSTAGVARSIEILGLVVAAAGVIIAAGPIMSRQRSPRESAEGPAERSSPAGDPWVAAASLPFKHEREIA